MCLHSLTRVQHYFLVIKAMLKMKKRKHWQKIHTENAKKYSVATFARRVAYNLASLNTVITKSTHTLVKTI